MLFEGRYIESDAVVDHLKLQSISQWTEDIALQLAAEEGIQMSEEHWEIVRFIRNFYFKFNTYPAVRILVKAMAQKYGEDKGNSVYLFRLFPQGPVRQATKIAGLPRSTKCL